MNFVPLAVAVAASVSLAACGGGGDGTSLSTILQGDTGPTGTCPNGSINDVWIDQRLSCLTVGQSFVNLSAGYVATGTATGDRAYVINQETYNTNFVNILGPSSNFIRYWAHFLCVRNAPLIGGGGGYNIGLAGDMQIALGLSALTGRLPAGVGMTSIGQYGGDRGGFVDMPCNAALHAVIVDYTTGKIISVNPSALSAQTRYTLP